MAAMTPSWLTPPALLGLGPLDAAVPQIWGCDVPKIVIRTSVYIQTKPEGTVLER